jgi:uncharacterized protein (TIGR00369 family)
MTFIGAQLTDVEPGFVEIVLDHDKRLTQQHGFFHGGIVGTLADNAAGYAAYSTAPEGGSVLAVEYKLNLMSPAQGKQLKAKAWVEKAGRTLVVCRCDISAVGEDGSEKVCAISQNTIMLLHGKSDSPESSATAHVSKL